MSWIDIGANLTDARLDFEPVFGRAVNARVTQMIITGTSVSASQHARDLALLYPQHLFCTAGVHPHHAKDFDVNTISQLTAIASSEQVVAIGECGLDFNRNFSTVQQQLFAFEQQLKLACELGLPVFLHERDAFAAQIKLLSQYRNELKGGVVHCFTGNIEQLNRYLELDLYIGITGWICDLKRGQALREAVKSLPLNRVLLETDAPYLRPKGLANNRRIDHGNNEPAYLPHVALEVASLMATDVKTLEIACEANTDALFSIVSKSAAHAK